MKEHGKNRIKQKKIKVPAVHFSPTLNGEPEVFEKNVRYYESCCNCGLVHFFFIEEIKGNLVLIKHYRDDWLTARAKKKTK